MAEVKTGEPIIDLALIWHQHQPNYFHPEKKEFVLPWVRLHAVKDYYDMAAWVKRFPKVHQTFNLVPSLLEQIEMYLDGRSTDTYWRLTSKRVDELTEEDKVFILDHFFDVEGSTMIHPHAPYARLWRKRGKGPVGEAMKRYMAQDFLDLQVWFNLAWTDPLFREEPGDACFALVKKGKNFTEEDKAVLIQRHREIMASVIPIHREIQDAGWGEIITTPFFHPILPVLCDSDIAKVCQPELPLLRPHFSHPEDARNQVAKAVDFYTERFGRRPRGMWPAEGSVSQAVIPIFAGAGVEWIATDEEILARSLKTTLRGMAAGDVDSPESLYQPYHVESGEHHIAMVFRDRRLSDLIGFDYYSMSAERAVDDFIARIDRARKRLANAKTRPLISIILDGENCWAAYPRDGHIFLENLYSRLSEHPGIRCVTVSEHLEEYKQLEKLPRLYPGSWINANYSIWIGHEEDNRAWQLLRNARTVVETADRSGVLPAETSREAWNEIHIAEGSDWFWWYGDEHHSPHDALFDQLFRSHLMRAYTLVGEEIPPVLYTPIASVARDQTRLVPQCLMTPTIDGRATHYFEWRAAATYDPRHDGGAMHKAESHLNLIRLGFDDNNLYLAIHRTQGSPRLVEGNSAVRVMFSEPVRCVLEIREDRQFLVVVMMEDSQIMACEDGRAGERDMLEVGIPWHRVPGKPGEDIRFSIQRIKDGEVVESCPAGKVLTFSMPGPSFDAEMWLV